MSVALLHARFKLSAADWWNIVWLVLLSLLLLTRNIHHVSHPTLWAEDGKLWFRDAYNKGFASLLEPHTGYLQSFPRLIALLGRLLPMRFLPGLLVGAGFVMQMAPVALLLWRGHYVISSGWARAALILFYIGMPNSSELYLNLTDAQWHFALLQLLLLAIPPPRSATARLGQNLVLLLGGLSGPFCLFLAPLAWVQVIVSRERRARVVSAGVLTFCALIQLVFMVQTYGINRNLAPLGASPIALARILTDQIILPAFIGTRGTMDGQKLLLHQNEIVIWALVAVAFVAVARACWRGPGLLRLLAGFSALVLITALRSPVVSADMPQWAAMDIVGAGCRYFFFPLLLWFSCLLRLSADPLPAIRFSGMFFALLCLVGIASDWHYYFAKSDTAEVYGRAARSFANAAPGEKITFPEDPPGWVFSLTKH
jgi:hypothetical protein